MDRSTESIRYSLDCWPTYKTKEMQHHWKYASVDQIISTQSSSKSNHRYYKEQEDTPQTWGTTRRSHITNVFFSIHHRPYQEISIPSEVCNVCRRLSPTEDRITCNYCQNTTSRSNQHLGKLHTRLVCKDK